MILADLKHALRSFRRDRTSAALAVVLLAATIGITAGVYSVVDGVLLRPWPFADPDRIVVVWQRDLARETPVVEVALGEAIEWHTRSRAFDEMAVFGSVNWSLRLPGRNGTERAAYAAVSPAFFSVAGTPPALGRWLRHDDETGVAPRVAVISHAFWQEHFGGDPSIIGRRIDGDDPAIWSRTESSELEVVGVMPPRFDFPRGARLWLPASPLLRAAARSADNPGAEAYYLSSFRVFYALGRLRAGVDAHAAGRELDGVLRSTEGAKRAGAAPAAVLTPINQYLTGPAGPVLWLMLAGAALMVLLACSSVAGLHVFRAARQDRAIAIQLALGAGRARLLRQVVTETALLAVAGGLGAGGVAWAVTRGLVAAAPLDIPRLSEATLGPSSFVLIAVIAAVTALASAAWPALFVLRVDPAPTLTSGLRTAMHPRERRLQRLAVGWQVALAVVILSGAAMFLRSVQRLDGIDPSFEAEGLWAVEVEPATQDLDRRDLFFEALLERVSAVRGVAAAAAVYLRPLSGPIGMDTIPVLPGQEGLGPDAPWRSNPRVNLESVTPGYFRTLGTRMVAGRDFSRLDRVNAPDAVVVSASSAARYWPGRDPVGERILVPTQRVPGAIAEPRFLTVVGVVEDVRYRGLTDPRLDIYLASTQSTMQVKHLMVRAAEPPIDAIRSIARELDPAAYLGPPVSMSDELARQSAPWRFAMRMLGGFGILAAVLATTALIGLISLVVTLRRRELGIRAALGATPGRLRWHVLAEATWIVAVATGTGLLVAILAGQLIGAMLVEVSPHDPSSLAAAALLTMLSGLFGCAWPAKRAASDDAVNALRE